MEYVLIENLSLVLFNNFLPLSFVLIIELANIPINKNSWMHDADSISLCGNFYRSLVQFDYLLIE